MMNKKGRELFVIFGSIVSLLLIGFLMFRILGLGNNFAYDIGERQKNMISDFYDAEYTLWFLEKSGDYAVKDAISDYGAEINLADPAFSSYMSERVAENLKKWTSKNEELALIAFDVRVDGNLIRFNSRKFLEFGDDSFRYSRNPSFSIDMGVYIDKQKTI